MNPILVFDTSTALACAVAKELKEMGFNVHSASSLDILPELIPNSILVLTGMSGYSRVADLTQDFIVMSGERENNPDLLIPFSREELRKTVEEALCKVLSEF